MTAAIPSLFCIALLLLKAHALLWTGGGRPIKQLKLQRQRQLPLSRFFSFPSSSSSILLATSKGGKQRLVANNNNNTAAELDDELLCETPDLDAMRARAGVLRTNILRQQIELQRLERQIVCCMHSQTSQPPLLSSSVWHQTNILYNQSLTTFRSSSNVLLRKLRRVETKSGPQNQKWDGKVQDYVTHQAKTAGRIVSNLVFSNPHQLKHLVDPETPTLLPHVPSHSGTIGSLGDSRVAHFGKGIEQQASLAFD